MRPIAWISSIALLAAAIATLGCTSEPEDSAAPTPELAGQYTMSGVNRDETTYSGTLVITPQGSHRYSMQWQDADSAYDGQGALVGDTLFVVWGSREAQCFVVFYELSEGGVLDGFWFRAGDPDPARGTERAVLGDPSQTNGPAGSYLVEGVAPDGEAYRRALEITALKGEFYRFHWGGEPTLEGVGQLEDGQIQVIASVAGHDGQCGKQVMTQNQDGTLSGHWTMNDDDYSTRGTEIAVPVE